MAIFQKIFSIFLSIILGISLVIGFLSFRTNNLDIYKNTLESNSFYSKASELSSGSSIDNVDYDRVLTFLIFDQVTESLVDDSWLRENTDKNLKLLESWLNGESQELNLFIPYDDINSTVQQNINQDILEFLEKNRSSVRVCNSTRQNQILKNGFNPGDVFCVPVDVRDGQETFSSFILGSSQDPILKKLYPQSIYADTSGVFDSNSLESTVKISNKLKPIKQISLFTRNNVVIISLILITLIILNLSWVYLLKKSIFDEVVNIILVSSLVSFLIGVIALLLFAFGGYIQDFFLSIIAEPFNTSSLVSLLSTVVFQIIFNLFLPQIITSFILTVSGISLMIASRVGLFESVKTKNQKLHQNKAKNFGSTTLDGSFKSALKKENLMRSFGGNPLLQEYDRQKALEKTSNQPISVNNKAKPSQNISSQLINKSDNNPVKPNIQSNEIANTKKSIPVNNPQSNQPEPVKSPLSQPQINQVKKDPKNLDSRKNLISDSIKSINKRIENISPQINVNINRYGSGGYSQERKKPSNNNPNIINGL